MMAFYIKASVKSAEEDKAALLRDCKRIPHAVHLRVANIGLTGNTICSLLNDSWLDVSVSKNRKCHYKYISIDSSGY